MPDKCKTCHSDTAYFSEATILEKYLVKYYRCPGCGFIQTESPYWLEEAYARPINISDTGIIARNISNASMVSAVLKLCFDSDAKFADYGGGHGIFVRMMRDRGFDFYRDDKFCSNLFANGFDVSDSDVNRFELVTAFEVFEHFVSPRDEIEKLLLKSDNILFTTEIVPFDPPQLSEWWYYCLDHGQHVSFFTQTSLKHIAEMLGLYYHNRGNINLLTRKKGQIVPFGFRLATIQYISRLINLISRKRSLTAADYKQLTGVELVNR